jgi:N-methylhydantoinase A
VVDEQDVIFDGERVPTKIYDRSRLQPGAALDGPAVVTEFDSTTVVLPGYRAVVDVNFNILINPTD